MHIMNPGKALFLLSALLASALTATAQTQPTPPAPAGLAKATFAGGCFWCMEPPFDVIDGVISTTSGYIAGRKANPTYQEVSAGVTGHTEAVEIVFDPKKVSFERLLHVFWRNIDPTDARGQFCDKGDQYRAAIFPRNEQQRTVATAAKATLDGQKRFPQPVAAAIIAATRFYVAEGYHQDYYKKNPGRYKFYKFNCGRAQRLAAVWGEP